MDTITIPTTFAAAWIVILAILGLLIQSVSQAFATIPATAKRVLAAVIAVLLGTIYMVATGAIPDIPTQAQVWVAHWFVIAAGILAVGQAVYAYLKPFLAKVEGIRRNAARLP